MKTFNQLHKYIYSALALLILSASSGANAALFALFLTAEGGVHDGETLYSQGPAPHFEISDISFIDFDPTGITFGPGPGGTTGSYAVTDIDINYFGTHYTMSDAIGAVSVNFDNGQMVSIDYVTQDFSLVMLPSFNTEEWFGSVVATPVPTPGALVLFSLALGSLGLRAFSKNRFAQE